MPGMEPSATSQAAAGTNTKINSAGNPPEDLMEETKDDDADDSMAEGKNADFAAIPSLKAGNNAANASNLNKQSMPFSYRLFNGSIKIDHRDVHAVANQMLFEINLLAGQLLILQHKIIEIVKTAPRFVSEYLQIQFEH